MDAISALLTVASRHLIATSNLEEGYERFVALSDERLTFESFREAIANGLRRGLIHEPHWLPERALQCQWHLALTQSGVETARQLERISDAQRTDLTVP